VSYQKIRVTDAGPVRTITLAAPEKRNAVGAIMVAELLRALGEARAAESVHVIVLAGEGKAFCAGGDFRDLSGGGGGAAPGGPRGDYADLLFALVRSDKPVIARVHGVAMGGGLGLVAASTFAIAEAGAQLGTPEIEVGLFPMMIMAVLARLVPRRALLEMMLTARRLDAEDARALGIVGRVVPSIEDLDREVAALAATLASKSPKAMSLGLRAFAAQDDLGLVEALPLLRERLAECLATEDAREGLAAFLEKRRPDWTGR
jgi:enoyl-CoA hydratase/carnithine racemase